MGMAFIDLITEDVKECINDYVETLQLFWGLLKGD